MGRVTSAVASAAIARLTGQPPAPPRRGSNEAGGDAGGICSRCDCWAPRLVPSYAGAPLHPTAPQQLLCPACCLFLAEWGGWLDQAGAWPDTTHLGRWADPTSEAP
jgi:hypothetical protein